MNSKILVVVLLAYFLDNSSAATHKPVKSTSLNGNNIQDQYKNTLVYNQPIKSHHPVSGNFKVNTTVPYKVRTLPSPPATPPAFLTPPPPPPANAFLPSIKKPLPPLKVPAPTTVPTNVNYNHQGFDIVEEGDDDYDYEEEDDDGYEEEYDDDYEEEEGDVEHLENSKTVEIPTNTKPTIFTKVNNNSNKFQTSQPMLSSSTSKPIVPESVKQENVNQQGFKTLEGDDDEEVEEEIDDEDHEEPLENSKTVQTSQPMLSSSTSKPIVPESVKQENDNQQVFETLEGDDEEVEYGDHEEPLASTYKSKQTLNGVRVNLPIPMNNPISTVPQLSEDELAENNYNKSKYYLNTDEDHSAFQDDEKWESEFYNNNNKPTEISETLDRKNDSTKYQSLNTNEFESNLYNNTQMSTDKQEENAEYQFKNQYESENKERIINGYKYIKKILYMLHDYASSTFDWIMNKINYRMEQVSS